jgi:hypothetical protein
MPSQSIENRCQCSFCESNFHCPACLVKPSVREQCQREAEAAEKLMQAELDRQANARRRAVDLEERQIADEVVTWGGEFWGGVGATGAATGAAAAAAAAAAAGLGLQTQQALPAPATGGGGGGGGGGAGNPANHAALVPSGPMWMALMAVQAGLEPSADAGAVVDLQDGAADDDDEEEGLEDMLEVEQL